MSAFSETTTKQMEAFDFSKPVEAQLFFEDSEDEDSKPKILNKELEKDEKECDNNGILKRKLESDAQTERRSIKHNKLDISLNVVEKALNNTTTNHEQSFLGEDAAKQINHLAYLDNQSINTQDNIQHVKTNINLVSENLILLFWELQSLRKNFKTEKSKQLLTHQKRLKSRYFNFILRIVEDCIIPRCVNYVFSNYFISKSIDIAYSKGIFATYQDIEELYNDMIEWSTKKLKLGPKNNKLGPSSDKLANEIHKPSDSQASSNRIFSFGPPGHQITISYNEIQNTASEPMDSRPNESSTNYINKLHSACNQELKSNPSNQVRTQHYNHYNNMTPNTKLDHLNSGTLKQIQYHTSNLNATSYAVTQMSPNQYHHENNMINTYANKYINGENQRLLNNNFSTTVYSPTTNQYQMPNTSYQWNGCNNISSNNVTNGGNQKVPRNVQKYPPSYNYSYTYPNMVHNIYSPAPNLNTNTVYPTRGYVDDTSMHRQIEGTVNNNMIYPAVSEHYSMQEYVINTTKPDTERKEKNQHYQKFNYYLESRKNLSEVENTKNRYKSKQEVDQQERGSCVSRDSGIWSPRIQNAVVDDVNGTAESTRCNPNLHT